MIHRKTIVAQEVSVGKEDELKLEDVLKLYNQIDKDRVPIFEKGTSRPLYILHRSTLVSYLTKFKNDNTEKK